ncbi:hypothetical protein BP5796_12718 [Coleophoma crateriformis]|uniref:Heterokaryon incompatibility domain-containing protein n=1 Tax=Coleophoma crateriformis TaxID=565419 RepID=A0A3D8Q6J5_9HELO|nr:hypothetical protein BP5796_12718 [Coleophoma crateriformis]
MDLSPTAFDPEQLNSIWKDGCDRCPIFPEQTNERFRNDTLHCDDLSFDADGTRMDDCARQNALNSLWTQLLTMTKDPAIHFKSLDSAVSERLVCQYQASELDPRVSAEVAVERASHLLTRLPAVPSQIDLTSYLWGDPSQAKPLRGYLTSNTSRDDNSANSRSAWAQLQVVSRVSSAVLKLSLLVTTCGNSRYSLGLSIKSFIDFVSGLIDAGTSFNRNSREYEIVGSSILTAFLWTTWQRSLMLFFWFVLKTHLALGYNHEWDTMLALRGCSQLMNPSVRETLYGWANSRHRYMCSWAFELLKSSRASMGIDFRRLHTRFSELHAGKAARCQFESDSACDGSHPLRCGRFLDKRLVQEEQSLHDEPCTGFCPKMAWNKESFMSVQGPTAVSLKTSSRQITYTQATESTLAISHVWSHGQGSRPHVGINKCLHRRYVGIAKALGCTSYWIDSMCIPDSHDLRSEAIGYINRIFADSKVTLVCDKDLMAIDISNLTRELLESILATFFVCDWNVRAWTLLEAMKGSHAIHILCKSNRVISLREALARTHQSGSVDIAILCLTAQHLIPSSTEAFRRSSSRQSTEVAGSLLSHRHATRENDDIVIWSLLSSPTVFKSAEQMWKSKINHRVATAYLISNTPRIDNIKGFSWAPKTPYIRMSTDHLSSDPLGPYNSFEGSNSELGLVTRHGLLAQWLVYHVLWDDAPIYRDYPVTMTSLSVSGERTQTVLPGQRIKNKCWELVESFRGHYANVVLLQPLMTSGGQAYDRSRNRGESHGDVFAICVSHDMERWTWKAVQAWPSSGSLASLPPLVSDKLLIE